MELSNDSENHSSRIFGLDIVRATAILLVVFFHSTPLLQPLTQQHLIGKPVLFIIKLLQWLGPIAVDLFFVLSGFLIGIILIKVVLKAENYKLHIIWEFWIKRWFRTLPNYLFLLTIGFALYKFLYNNPFDWRYYFFVQNFTHAIPNFFGETWSLSVEEWTYLLLPLFILLMTKLFYRSEKRAVLIYTFIIYLFIAITIRFLKVFKQDYHDLDEEIRKATIYRLDSIIYGVIVAYLIYFYKDLMFKYRKISVYGGMAGVPFILLLSFWGLHHPGVYHINSGCKIIMDTLFFSLIPLCFAMTIPAAYFLKDISPSMIKKAVTHISLTSYSTYLIHNTLIFIPFFLPLAVNPSGLSIIFYYVLYLLILFLLSAINYKYIEKPTTRLRDVFIAPADKKILKA